MAASKDYPRQAVHTLRQGRRAEAEIALHRAHTALEQARSSTVEATRALDQHVAAAPDGDPGNGLTSAHILQREAAFSERQAQKARRLRGLLQKAQAREFEATGEYTRTQRLLADAHAAEQVLDHDRERFDADQRKLSVVAEEREAEEQRAKGRPPRRR